MSRDASRVLKKGLGGVASAVGPDARSRDAGDAVCIVEERRRRRRSRAAATRRADGVLLAAPRRPDRSLRDNSVSAAECKSPDATPEAFLQLPAKAVVLLSGGLDSATCFLIAREERFEIFALSFDYGQRHKVELERAGEIARRYGAREHRLVRLDYPGAAASALTDPSIPIPKDRLGEVTIPVTYVPARNTLFLANALAYAEALGAADIFIGANALDSSGYPDCRAEYLSAFEQAANLGTKAGAEGERPFRIRAPLLALTKGQIVARAAALGLDFALTSSCYDPSPLGAACESCDACLLREKGFAEAGLTDPLVHREREAPR